MKRNTRNSNRGTRQASRRKDDRVVTLLERINRSTSADSDRMMPTIMDVPPMILSRGRTYTTSFSYTASTIASNNVSHTPGGLQFTLSNVPEYASWTGAFDAYRILHVNVQFVPVSTPPASASNTGSVYTVLDYDDVNTPNADPGYFVQYDTLQVVSPGTYFERNLVPRLATAAYGGSLFNSYTQVQGMWIDAASATTPYYGIKYLATVSSIALQLYTPIVTLTVQFRDAH